MEVVCQKCELAIGKHSVELHYLQELAFLPERVTVLLQKLKLSSSDLCHSSSWTGVTTVVKFAFLSDGCFYQSQVRLNYSNPGSFLSTHLQEKKTKYQRMVSLKSSTL